MSRSLFMAALVAYITIFWDSQRLDGVRQSLCPVVTAPVQLAGTPGVSAFPGAGPFR